MAKQNNQPEQMTMEEYLLAQLSEPVILKNGSTATKLADLDPVRDYSEINGIGHKRQCIRQDFRQLMEKTNKFSKNLLNS